MCSFNFLPVLLWATADYLKTRSSEALQWATAWTGESLFFARPFQSNGEKETEKTQGHNPLSTQAPFMGVLG